MEYVGKRMGLRFSFLRMYNLMKNLIKLEFYSSCNRISTLLVCCQGMVVTSGDALMAVG